MTLSIIMKIPAARRRPHQLLPGLATVMLLCCILLTTTSCTDAEPGSTSTSLSNTATSNQSSAETVALVAALIPAIFNAQSDPQAATEALVKLTDLQPQTPYIIKGMKLAYRSPESITGDYIYLIGDTEFIITTNTARAWVEIINTTIAVDHSHEHAVRVYDTLDAILTAAMRTSADFTIKYPGTPWKQPTPNDGPFLIIALLRAALLDKMRALGEHTITPEHQQRIDKLREIFNKREITQDIP